MKCYFRARKRAEFRLQTYKQLPYVRSNW